MSEVAQRETTVLVSSHNLRELEDICDYVGIIHKGKMIIEKPLDDIKGSVHKFQLAFKGDFPEALAEKVDILHQSRLGSVYSLIIKGDAEAVKAQLEEFSPVICDVVNLTLEEVFIYELGGLGYDFKGILI